MSDITGEVQPRVEVACDRPLVVEAGTTSDEAFSAAADELRRRVLAVISGESAVMNISTSVERVADRPASAGLVEYDTENQIEVTQATLT